MAAGILVATVPVKAVTGCIDSDAQAFHNPFELVNLFQLCIQVVDPSYNISHTFDLPLSTCGSSCMAIAIGLN
jgi:hypothetical protein